MSDNTWVKIHITKYDFARLIDTLFDGDENKFESEVYYEDKTESVYGEHIIEFYSPEEDGGEWDSLESILRDNKIEYNKDWGDGNEYSGGEGFYRNVDGDYKCLEIYTSDQARLEELNEVDKIINEGGDIKQIKDFIQKRMKYYMPFTPEPLHKPVAIRYVEED